MTNRELVSYVREQFPTQADQERECQRLFGILEDLVKWENTNNEEVLGRARAEIMRSTDGNLPAVLDPFCGGGSIPLEAHALACRRTQATSIPWQC